jgi:hypothetical protein
MITHAGNVTSTAFKDVHRGYLIASRLLLLRWAMSTARKWLIIKSQICNFWEKTLLSTHGKLLMIQHCVVLYIVLVLNSSWMQCLGLIGTIITLSVTLCFVLRASKHTDLLLLLLPALSGNTVIILLVLNPILLRLDRVSLHIRCSPMRVWAVTMTLSARRI